jgi:hypothetical protein
MRYIDLTTPPEIVDVLNESGDVVKQDVLTLEGLLNANCWGLPEWRQNEEWLGAWERLIDIFGVAFKTKAKFCAVEDKDYEKLAPIATLKGKQISPHLARAVTRLTAPITRAASKEPESAKASNGADAKTLPEHAPQDPAQA